MLATIVPQIIVGLPIYAAIALQSRVLQEPPRLTAPNAQRLRVAGTLVTVGHDIVLIRDPAFYGLRCCAHDKRAVVSPSLTVRSNDHPLCSQSRCTISSPRPLGLADGILAETLHFGCARPVRRHQYGSISSGVRPAVRARRRCARGCRPPSRRPARGPRTPGPSPPGRPPGHPSARKRGSQSSTAFSTTARTRISSSSTSRPSDSRARARNIPIVERISALAPRIRSRTRRTRSDCSSRSSNSRAPPITVRGVLNSWLAAAVKLRSRSMNAHIRVTILSIALANSPASFRPK